MLAAFRQALAARRAAVLEAEAMIANFDYAGLRQAMDRSADPMLAHADRLHHERVVLIALRRQRELDCADRRTKDTIIERWTFRRGSRVKLR